MHPMNIFPSHPGLTGVCLLPGTKMAHERHTRGLHCLPFHLYLVYGKTTLFKFQENYSNVCGVLIFQMFMVNA